jgi:signal transduction histidine kinase
MKPARRKKRVTAPKAKGHRAALAELEQAHRRLQHLYELTKLFASFETVEETFDPVLAVVTRTLPIRSAILIEAEGERSKMFVWNSRGTPDQMSAAKQHAEAAYAYFIGAASTEALAVTEKQGKTALPPQPPIDERTERFIVIPLVVAHRRPFGVLQVEGARGLVKSDLMFVNSIANQLAIALDRDHAWGADIDRREQAELGRRDAEVRGAASERGRVLADSSSNENAALAEENASLYAEARQAVQVREQVLAIVSHDLRSPLATILMGAGMLAQRDDGLEERRRGVPQTAKRIERAAQRMVRLIEDLLDFASIEAGSLAIKLERQDPGAMLDEAVASFESVAEGKGLTLTAQVQAGLPNVSCDRDRILQLFSNLVGNATKVTNAGGQVTLGVEVRGPELVFWVKDTGPGISAEDAKHLFERYWRSGEAKYRGTGLGLAIARGIAVAHGGRIWVKSKPGDGATFFFSLPAAIVPGTVRPPRRSAPR